MRDEVTADDKVRGTVSSEKRLEQGLEVRLRTSGRLRSDGAETDRSKKYDRFKYIRFHIGIFSTIVSVARFFPPFDVRRRDPCRVSERAAGRDVPRSFPSGVLEAETRCTQFAKALKRQNLPNGIHRPGLDNFGLRLPLRVNLQSGTVS
jgi:hypothetical protein